MKLKHTTPVPNEFFDKLMSDLSGSAIRVYLKIVRNTLGWRDKNGQVKVRDWISHSQFEKVGLSNRSVSNAINELIDKNVISTSDYIGNDLSNPEKRKKASRVYYSLNNVEDSTLRKEKNDLPRTQGMLSTKENLNKKYNANERISDRDRLSQILEEEQRKQIERDSWT